MSYKLLSFKSGGEARAGLLVGEQVYDAARVTGKPAWATVLGALQEWPKAHREFAAFAKRIAAKLLAPVLYPGNIYCAGANYTDHMAEMARAQGKEPGPTMKDLGEKPWHFVKTSRSSVVGPGSKVKLPAYSQKVDWEVELVAVIGRTVKDVPVGELRDPHQLAIKLWVNGELMQDSHTSKLIFDTAEQIAMLSSRVTLRPGDLVLTGTPAGVGMGRGRFLKPGDAVKLWIEAIGELNHTLA